MSNSRVDRYFAITKDHNARAWRRLKNLPGKNRSCIQVATCHCRTSVTRPLSAPDGLEVARQRSTGLVLALPLAQNLCVTPSRMIRHFSDETWDALCCMGLRVHSRGQDMTTDIEGGNAKDHDEDVGPGQDTQVDEVDLAPYLAGEGVEVKETSISPTEDKHGL